MSSSFLLRGSGGAQSSSRRSVPVVLRRLSSFLIIGTILLATIAHAPYATSAAPITRRAHVAVADRNDHPTMTQQSSSSSTTSTPPTATMLNELFSFVQQVISTDGQYSWLFGVFLAAMASIISNLGLTLQVRNPTRQTQSTTTPRLRQGKEQLTNARAKSAHTQSKEE